VKHLRRATLLIALVVLTACTGPSAAVPTAAPPTGAPTAALPTAPATASPAEATPAPQPAPTALQPVASILPAPLYILAGGQIVRIERDGVTRKQITDEPPPDPDALAIVQFDVSPVDGTIVYVVQGAGAPPLLVRIAADGSNRTVLSDNLYITSPLISPDGTTIAVGVSEDYERPGSQTPGIYALPIAGGAPRLILADIPATDPTTEGGDGRGFTAVAWSPDGTKLLANAYSLSVELCELAIVDVASGDQVYLGDRAANLSSACTPAAWSPDGRTVLFNTGDPALALPDPGIWRYDVSGGSMSSLPVEPDNAIVYAPHIAGDTLYAFVASTDGTNPVYSPAAPEPALSYTLSSVPLTGGTWTALRNDTHSLFSALWAPDGSGVVVFGGDDPTRTQALWLASDGSPAVELYTGTDLYAARWGAP
jgi:dipeptidyl aminopeptidase/acylaminoacyl peptidase